MTALHLITQGEKKLRRNYQHRRRKRRRRRRRSLSLSAVHYIVYLAGLERFHKNKELSQHTEELNKLWKCLVRSRSKVWIVLKTFTTCCDFKHWLIPRFDASVVCVCNVFSSKCYLIYWGGGYKHVYSFQIVVSCFLVSDDLITKGSLTDSHYCLFLIFLDTLNHTGFHRSDLRLTPTSCKRLAR